MQMRFFMQKRNLMARRQAAAAIANPVMVCSARANERKRDKDTAKKKKFMAIRRVEFLLANN